MKSSDIRKQFIDYFLQKDHKFVRSSSVVPIDDPTLLFTNAGMNQFKDIFLDIKKPTFSRAVNSQKCIRVSGKHNDLEEVGVDNFHHTFFEMLGNWSFGDYYKEESIIWSWELFTKVWKIDVNRLWVSVYKDDDEAYDFWSKIPNLDNDRILRFGNKDNFWEMGETGPCGPCSEIHYYIGEDIGNQDPKGVNVLDEYRELWNLVFIQYNRENDGSLIDLPMKHVDTGMGLERITSILNKQYSHYETDIFKPIIDKIVDVSGKDTNYKNSVPHKVIADHLRMLSFSIADGAVPSNDGRGYVLRRVLRRAVRYGDLLGIKDNFMHLLIDDLISIMGKSYPEIVDKKNHIVETLKREEESFRKTLDKGLIKFEEMLKDSVEESLKDEDDQVSESDITQNLEDALKDMQMDSNDEDQSKFADKFDHFDEDGKSLEAIEDNQYLYDEWDFRDETYKKNWCLVNEKTIGEGDLVYYEETLEKYSDIVKDIKKKFELINPETYRKIKRLQDGEEQDLDLTVEAMIDLRSGITPSEKLYWRRNKVERSIAVAFLLDMSASTAEAIDDSSSQSDEWSAPSDPEKYMEWLRKRRSQGFRRSYKRIVDLEKEGLILLLDALETLGDKYGIFGFSGYGRENVEYYTIKDLDEKFSPTIPKRIDRISPLHATRMGPAVRHCASKLMQTDERSKFIFLISDGRPQDRGYSREGVEKEYAVNDTKKALLEAKKQGITTFCLTVDKEGHDYMKSMMDDLSYEVLDDISSLPLRIPQLYKNLTSD